MPTEAIKNAEISVVIPCYNADRWIGEAIDSCLNQTLAPAEIIVVDDGSTDNSAQVIQSFGNQIRYLRQDNSGAQRARNTGFDRSCGKFIQFLDADDFLMPEKFEHQVKVLQETDAMVVYGDWQHQHHEPDGRFWREAEKVSGRPPDILEALLSGWWVSPAALMFRRDIIEKIGGWDESLSAAQDRDFFQQIALATNQIAYAPGCQAVYRRYGAVTVSTGSLRRYALNHLKVTEKMDTQLRELDKLTPTYRAALARSYFGLARNIIKFDRDLACNVEEKARALDPGFLANTNNIYQALYRLVGFARAEQITSIKRRLFGHQLSDIS